MRTLLVAATLLLSLGAARADEDNPKLPTTAAPVMEMCGARLSKVFAKFGVPEDVSVSRGSKPELDTVIVEYGKFRFQVRDKTVHTVLFDSWWHGTVKGVKIGDSREQVAKVLGAAQKTAKSSLGVEDYAYSLKDLDATLWTDFDKDEHVRLIEVQLN